MGQPEEFFKDFILFISDMEEADSVSSGDFETPRFKFKLKRKGSAFNYAVSHSPSPHRADDRTKDSENDDTTISPPTTSYDPMQQMKTCRVNIPILPINDIPNVRVSSSDTDVVGPLKPKKKKSIENQQRIQQAADGHIQKQLSSESPTLPSLPQNSDSNANVSSMVSIKMENVEEIFSCKENNDGHNCLKCDRSKLIEDENAFLKKQNIEKDLLYEKLEKKLKMEVQKLKDDHELQLQGCIRSQQRQIELVRNENTQFKNEAMKIKADHEKIIMDLTKEIKELKENNESQRLHLMEEKEHLKFENEELFEKILRLEQQLNEEESAKEVWKAGVVVEKRNCELKVQSCYESIIKFCQERMREENLVEAAHLKK